MKRKIALLTVFAVLAQSCWAFHVEDGHAPARGRHHANGRFSRGHHRHRGHRRGMAALSHRPPPPPPPPVALPLTAPNSSKDDFPLETEMIPEFHDKELECLIQFEIEPYPTLWRDGASGESDGGEGDERFEGVAVFCNRSWDRLLCWPTTLASTAAVLPCFEELNGIKYDTMRE